MCMYIYIYIYNETGKTPIIKWDIVKRVQGYKGGYNNSRLSLEKKLCIQGYAENNKLVNKKSELNSNC